MKYDVSLALGAWLAAIAAWPAAAAGDGEPPPFLTSFGAETHDAAPPHLPHEFGAAWDVAPDSAGELFVCDSLLGRVQKFTAAGTYLAEWPVATAYGLAVGPGDEVFVQTADSVRVFDADGVPLRQWGSLGSGPGQFSSPAGIDAVESGVYVADTGNLRVQRFELDGSFAGEWSLPSNAAPRDVAVGPGGDVFVSCTIGGPPFGEPMIRRYTSDGELVAAWGELGMEPGGPSEFHSPLGVAVDAEGAVYVTEASYGYVQKFRGDGSFEWLLDLSSLPAEPGMAPLGITAGASGNLQLVNGNPAPGAGVVGLFGDAPLTLAADVDLLVPGEPLRLRLFGGQASAPMALLLTAVNGVPTSALIELTLLDGFGAWAASAPAPALSGSELHFRAFSVDGVGALRPSNEISVSIE